MADERAKMTYRINKEKSKGLLLIKEMHRDKFSSLQDMIDCAIDEKFDEALDDLQSKGLIGEWRA